MLGSKYNLGQITPLSADAKDDSKSKYNLSKNPTTTMESDNRKSLKSQSKSVIMANDIFDSKDGSLTYEDVIDAGRSLNIKPELISVVAKVETRGEAFLPSGKPKILFERHWMYRLLRKDGYTSKQLRLLQQQYPDVVNSEPGGYVGGEDEYKKLIRASRIHKEIAHQCISMGKFQIMGFHYKRLGYSSAVNMLKAASKEKEHLMMLVKFIKTDKNLLSSLRNLDFDGFASVYNGENYRDNNYAGKMRSHYERMTV